MISETEKLAIEVEDMPFKGWSTDIGTRVAAELRRLVAESAMCRAALQDEMQKNKRLTDELEALKRAISDAKPEAWQWLDTANFRKKIPAGATPSHWTPLYTLKGIK